MAFVSARSCAKDCLVPLRQQGKKSRELRLIVILAECLDALDDTGQEKVAPAVPHAQSQLGHLTWPLGVLLVSEATPRSAQFPSETPHTQRPSLNYSTSSRSTGIHDHPTPSSPASPAPFAGSANLPSSTASPTP